MQGEPDGFWAKLRRDEEGRVTEWHPLRAHCADVAAATEALLTRSILRRRMGRLLGEGELSDAHLGRLCVLAALHDAGKVNHGFQQRAHASSARPVGHVRPLVDFLTAEGREKEAIIDALGLAEMFEWFGSEEEFIAFLLACFGHHGQPVAPGTRFKPKLWRPAHGRDPLDEMRRLRGDAARWFPAAFAAEGEPFCGSPEFQHAFNGLLILADWIGSDERFFAYADSPSDRMPPARQRAAEAVAKLGLDPADARQSMGEERPGFSSIVPPEFSPRPVQRVCCGLRDHPDGSLTILESDTGSGKTEAALARFSQLFHAGLVDGMYFALPTRTAATQLHGRVVSAMERAFPDPAARPATVLAVPGYLSVDRNTGQRLAPFRVLWDDDENWRWHSRGWAAERPKRFLAGTVAVGTVDQVLLSTLQVKHAHLRAGALLRHLLVVDEVHASDPYMDRLLEEVLDHHLRAGGHAFLMSATLGSAAHSRFMGGRHATPPPLEEARRRAYPLLAHADGERQRVESIPAEPTGYSKSVAVEAGPIAGQPESVADLARQAARRGARVLVIRNTVGDCIATQTALEQLAGGDDGALFKAAGVIAPHHSRFSGPDRKVLDRAIEREFGKGAEGGGVVAIATQTVQQSLDLDADLMLSDLCPVDVLLQRIGRLHRHPGARPPEARPDGFGTPRTLVLVPEERSLGTHIAADGRAYGPHGLGTVYEDLRILEATWRLVEQRQEWTIPAMNRTLVEDATHPEALHAIAESLGEEWLRHEKQILGIRAADSSHAGLVLLRRDKPFGDPATLFPRDLDERIKTRLGEGDRRIEFQSPIRSPFGEQFSELTIPAYQVPDDSEEAEPENVETGEGRLCFDFAGQSFTYDRTGLH